MITLQKLLNITPTPMQLNILTDNSDNIIVASSRRVGKSVTALMAILRVALDFDSYMAWRGNEGYRISAVSPTIIAVVTPTRDMAKTIYFQPLVELIERNKELKAIVKDINKTSLTISFHGNRPSILMGSTNDDANSWRGKSIVYLLADEVQDQPFAALEESLKPAMTSIKGSQMLAIGSPKGQGANALWKLKVLCDKFPEYYSFHKYTIFDNPHIPKETIRQEIATKTPSVFAREYLADFSNYAGMVYDVLSEGNKVSADSIHLVKDRKTENHIVRLGVDFGSSNGAISVLALAHDSNDGYRWVFLEGWQNKTGGTISGLDFKRTVLHYARKYRVVSIYCDPANPGDILDIRNMSESQGLTRYVVSGYNKILEGISTVSDLLYTKKLVFLEDDFTGELENAFGLLEQGNNIVTGIEAYELFAAYRYATDRDGAINDQKIAQGINDHIADSVRYILADKDPRKPKAILFKPAPKKADPRLEPDSLKFDPSAAYRSAVKKRIA